MVRVSRSRVLSTRTSSKVTCHFAVLGLPATASKVEVKNAYYRCLLKTHPDMHPGADGDALKALEVRVSALVEANTGALDQVEKRDTQNKEPTAKQGHHRTDTERRQQQQEREEREEREGEEAWQQKQQQQQQQRLKAKPIASKADKERLLQEKRDAISQRGKYRSQKMKPTTPTELAKAKALLATVKQEEAIQTARWLRGMQAGEKEKHVKLVRMRQFMYELHTIKTRGRLTSEEQQSIRHLEAYVEQLMDTHLAAVKKSVAQRAVWRP